MSPCNQLGFIAPRKALANYRIYELLSAVGLRSWSRGT